jgi:hypothetical protein
VGANIGDGSDITTWSAVESSTGLFCACAAPLKPLYRILCGRAPFTSIGTSASNYVYARRTNAYYTTAHHPDDELDGKQVITVSVSFGLETDIESTADLVRPIPTAQSWPLTNIAARVGEQV